MVSQFSSNVKAVYKATRFTVAKDTWPPEQPKEYTPLVLLHREDEHTMEHVTTISQALHSGAISDVTSANNATTKISEILAPLEITNKPQTILIEGAPGIGKTILLKQIAYNWAELEMLQKYELLLLVYLRDPTVQKVTSLKELLQYICSKHNIEGHEFAIIFRYISCSQGKTLTFLFDGYDEMPEELRNNG